MPYLITSSVYPTDKSKAVAEVYLEAIEKFPPDESIAIPIVPAAVISTHEGVKTLNIVDVQKGNLENALRRAAKMMVMFKAISGFRYKIDIYNKVEEALALIGLGLDE